MIPPMSWARCWRIIRHLQANGLPTTPGHLNYLRSEIDRMTPAQARCVWYECPGLASHLIPPQQQPASRISA
jgi:hypothetical protein